MKAEKEEEIKEKKTGSGEPRKYMCYKELKEVDDDSFLILKSRYRNYANPFYEVCDRYDLAKEKADRQQFAFKKKEIHLEYEKPGYYMGQPIELLDRLAVILEAEEGVYMEKTRLIFHVRGDIQPYDALFFQFVKKKYPEVVDICFRNCQLELKRKELSLIGGSPECTVSGRRYTDADAAAYVCKNLITGLTFEDFHIRIIVDCGEQYEPFSVDDVEKLVPFQRITELIVNLNGLHHGSQVSNALKTLFAKGLTYYTVKFERAPGTYNLEFMECGAEHLGFSVSSKMLIMEFFGSGAKFDFSQCREVFFNNMSFSCCDFGLISKRLANIENLEFHVCKFDSLFPCRCPFKCLNFCKFLRCGQKRVRIEGFQYCKEGILSIDNASERLNEQAVTLFVGLGVVKAESLFISIDNNPFPLFATTEILLEVNIGKLSSFVGGLKDVEEYSAMALSKDSAPRHLKNFEFFSCHGHKEFFHCLLAIYTELEELTVYTPLFFSSYSTRSFFDKRYNGGFSSFPQKLKSLTIMGLSFDNYEEGSVLEIGLDPDDFKHVEKLSISCTQQVKEYQKCKGILSNTNLANLSIITKYEDGAFVSAGWHNLIGVKIPLLYMEYNLNLEWCEKFTDTLCQRFPSMTLSMYTEVPEFGILGTMLIGKKKNLRNLVKTILLKKFPSKINEVLIDHMLSFLCTPTKGGPLMFD